MKEITSAQIRNNLALLASFAFAIQLFMGATTKAEDGYRLWLRYEPLTKQMIGVYGPHVTSVVVPGDSATVKAIRAELVDACSGLLGSPIPSAGGVDRDGAVVVGNTSEFRSNKGSQLAAATG